MQKPPETDRSGENQQSEDLVTPEGTRLLLARFFLGDLLVMRLDAGADQDESLPRNFSMRHASV
jgi:hypothetical protein